MLFDVAMLGVCFAAFGNDVPPAGVLLIAYLIGQLGSLIPIPGGLGGVDGGLIGTLILYGVDRPPPRPRCSPTADCCCSARARASGDGGLQRRLRQEPHDIATCAPGQPVEVLGRGPRPA